MRRSDWLGSQWVTPTTMSIVSFVNAPPSLLLLSVFCVLSGTCCGILLCHMVKFNPKCRDNYGLELYFFIRSIFEGWMNFARSKKKRNKIGQANPKYARLWLAYRLWWSLTQKVFPTKNKLGSSKQIQIPYRIFRYQKKGTGKVHRQVKYIYLAF